MSTTREDIIHVMYCDEPIGYIGRGDDGEWSGWYLPSTSTGDPMEAVMMLHAGRMPKTLTVGIRNFHAAVLGISREQMRVNEDAYYMAACKDPDYLDSIEDSDVFG